MFCVRVLVKQLCVLCACLGEATVCSVCVSWWSNCVFCVRVLVEQLCVLCVCLGDATVCSVCVSWWSNCVFCVRVLVKQLVSSTNRFTHRKGRQSWCCVGAHLWGQGEALLQLNRSNVLFGPDGFNLMLREWCT